MPPFYPIRAALSLTAPRTIPPVIPPLTVIPAQAGIQAQLTNAFKEDALKMIGASPRNAATGASGRRSDSRFCASQFSKISPNRLAAAGHPVLNCQPNFARYGFAMLDAADAPTDIIANANPGAILTARQAAAMDSLRRLADAAGVAAYLVGGPVRDGLLGTPASDLDITITGDAPAIAQQLADAVSGRLTIHHRFGTATVAWDDLTVDLVTARRETYSAPAALPVVQPGDLSADLARRDFTINAMAMPIDDDLAAAKIVDPHGGQADLRAGIIRTLHRQSFRDDPTRILRAIRYEQRFGFRIADATGGDLQSAVDAGVIALLSGDRVRHELARILDETHPLPALRRAAELGILQSIHPALSAAHLTGLAADGMADWTASATPLAWLSALAWPLTPAQSSALSARLNAPSDWTRAMADAANLSATVDALGADGLTPSQVCALLDGCAPAALAAGAVLAPPLAAARIRQYRSEWWTVAPRLRGSDLLALGIPAGPAVGAILRALRQARLDGCAPTRQDEERLARQSAGISSAGIAADRNLPADILTATH